MFNRNHHFYVNDVHINMITKKNPFFSHLLLYMIVKILLIFLILKLLQPIPQLTQICLKKYLLYIKPKNIGYQFECSLILSKKPVIFLCRPNIYTHMVKCT